MTIKENSAVSFHYTLTDDDGQTLDSSAGKDPLAYLHGAGNIIPGLENALAGKKIGDSMVVAVTAAEGYGEVQQELIQEVPRDAFQGVDSIEVGMQFLCGCSGRGMSGTRKQDGCFVLCGLRLAPFVQTIHNVLFDGWR